MTFSVIIPCYNCVKTLEATVNSIRACGLTDYEILLVDDGSSDGTAKLCDFGVSIRKMQVFPLHAIVALTRRRESISGLWMQMTR